MGTFLFIHSVGKMQIRKLSGHLVLSEKRLVNALETKYSTGVYFRFLRVKRRIEKFVSDFYSMTFSINLTMV